MNERKYAIISIYAMFLMWMTKSIPWASRSEAVTRQTASLPILHYDFGVNFPIHTRNTCQILQHSNTFPTPSVSIWNCWINRKRKLVTLSLLLYTMSFMTLQGLSDIIFNFDVTSLRYCCPKCRKFVVNDKGCHGDKRFWYQLWTLLALFSTLFHLSSG